MARWRKNLFGLLVVFSSPGWGAEPTCAELLRGHPIYRLENPERRTVARSWSGEARAIVEDAYPYILGRAALAGPEKRALVDWLDDEGTGSLSAFPKTFPEWLRKLHPNERYALRQALRDANEELTRTLARDYLRNHLPATEWTPAEIRAEFLAHDQYFRVSRPLETIRRPDGTINMKKLLTTRRLASPRELAEGKPLLLTVTLAPGQVTAVFYAILVDPDGKARMRLAVHDETYQGRVLDMGLRFHTHVALGDDPDFTGDIYLSRLGEVRGIDVHSGHFMAFRRDSIEAFARGLGMGPDVADGVVRAATEHDRARLRDLVKRELNLPTRDFFLLASEKEWDARLRSGRIQRAVK